LLRRCCEVAARAGDSLEGVNTHYRVFAGLHGADPSTFALAPHMLHEDDGVSELVRDGRFDWRDLHGQEVGATADIDHL